VVDRGISKRPLTNKRAGVWEGRAERSSPMTLSLLPPLFEVPPATTVVFNAEFDENSSIHELFVQEVVALNAPNFSMPTEVVQKKVLVSHNGARPCWCKPMFASREMIALATTIKMSRTRGRAGCRAYGCP